VFACDVVEAAGFSLALVLISRGESDPTPATWYITSPHLTSLTTFSPKVKNPANEKFVGDVAPLILPASKASDGKENWAQTALLEIDMLILRCYGYGCCYRQLPVQANPRPCLRDCWESLFAVNGSVPSSRPSIRRGLDATFWVLRWMGR